MNRTEILDIYYSSLQELQKHRGVLSFMHVGSSVYMDDAKDVDIAALTTPQQMGEIVTGLKADGWAELSDDAYDGQPGEWRALRKGLGNIMITHDAEWFKKYHVATELCKALELTSKVDRIITCRVVRDGYMAHQARAEAERHVAKQKEDEEL